MRSGTCILRAWLTAIGLHGHSQRRCTAAIGVHGHSYGATANAGTSLCKHSGMLVGTGSGGVYTRTCPVFTSSSSLTA